MLIKHVMSDVGKERVETRVCVRVRERVGGGVRGREGERESDT